ncbi:MAG: hypothetical protein QG639_341 [Patescibacteria group bacterium]|nr:hypothetical protein [Patescibacteria group bacterium]
MYNSSSSWTRGVVVNMLPCHGRDRRFESGRVRQAFLSLPLVSLHKSAIIALFSAQESICAER